MGCSAQQVVFLVAAQSGAGAAWRITLGWCRAQSTVVADWVVYAPTGGVPCAARLGRARPGEQHRTSQGCGVLLC